ncbi:MAG: HEAT repeat domain-containing protein [Blastocatellia bacterium]|nr:HEAT repeat domain-containing protein [Blastocatellia bacterium]
MNRFIRLVFSGLCAFLPSPQDRTPDIAPQQLTAIHRTEVKNKVERLIQSDSNKDRAWAAYLIGEYKLKEFAPALIELLNPNSLDPEWETGFVYRAVLDSLIKLGVSAPSDNLTPLYKRFPDETLIIMARSPSEHGEDLLSIAEQPRREVCWVAACNLLAESKAPGFAAFLLKSLKIKVEIGVYDGGNRMGVGGGSSLCVGDGVFQVPDGFPPTALYQLTDEPRRDAVVVAPGAHPVFYERQVIEPGIANQRGIGVYNSSVERDRYCIEYLATLLNLSVSQLEIREMYSKSIVWAGIERYKVEAISFRELIKGNFERLKRQCVEKNLLSESDAEALKPNLIITVRDMRGNKTPPLPEISGVAR